MNYAEKLKDPRWQKRRLEIFNRDSFKCRVCRDDKTTLHVHHRKYSGEPWEAPEEDLITVCEHCHRYFMDEDLNSDISVLKLVYPSGSAVTYFCSLESGLVIRHVRFEEDAAAVDAAVSWDGFKDVLEFLKDKIGSSHVLPIPSAEKEK